MLRINKGVLIAVVLGAILLAMVVGATQHGRVCNDGAVATSCTGHGGERNG